MSQTVEYLKIYKHTSEPASDTATSGDVFEAIVNPSNIKTRRSIIFNSNSRANAGFDVMQYQGHGPIEFEITLEITDFDGNRDDSKTVASQIEQLLKVTYDYDGSIHKSPYITAHWATFAFLGHLKDMCIDYQTFNADGSAKHAVVELLFVSHINSLANAHTQNRNSPDMTHMKLMKEGDKIPLICDDIYDDPTYYIQVAELNNLTNFRNVQAGKQIIFPPLVN